MVQRVPLCVSVGFIYNKNTYTTTDHQNHSSILGNVKEQKPYFPPPKAPPANTTHSNQHMDPLAAAEAVASGVLVKVKELMAHPTFQKVRDISCLKMCT